MSEETNHTPKPRGHRPARYGESTICKGIWLPPSLWEEIDLLWKAHPTARSRNDLIAITLMEQFKPELLAKP